MQLDKAKQTNRHVEDSRQHYPKPSVPCYERESSELQNIVELLKRTTAKYNLLEEAKKPLQSVDLESAKKISQEEKLKKTNGTGAMTYFEIVNRNFFGNHFVDVLTL
jgi:hypothetical protein